MSDYCADLVIHIDEDLDDDQIHELEAEFARLEGIYSACVHERARHLMLVDFDPADLEPGLLLDRMRSRGLHAERVGL